MSALQRWGKRGGLQDEALGRSKGGFITKIHAVVGGLARKVPFRPRHALGNPLRLLLTAGNRPDVTQAQSLLEGWETTRVLADKGYDSDAVLATVATINAEAVIPPTANRVV